MDENGESPTRKKCNKAMYKQWTNSRGHKCPTFRPLGGATAVSGPVCTDDLSPALFHEGLSEPRYERILILISQFTAEQTEASKTNLVWHLA